MEMLKNYAFSSLFNNKNKSQEEFLMFSCIMHFDDKFDSSGEKVDNVRV